MYAGDVDPDKEELAPTAILPTPPLPTAAAEVPPPLTQPDRFPAPRVAVTRLDPRVRVPPTSLILPPAAPPPPPV